MKYAEMSSPAASECIIAKCAIAYASQDTSVALFIDKFEAAVAGINLDQIGLLEVCAVAFHYVAVFVYNVFGHFGYFA
jgi:hypothetical protein